MELSFDNLLYSGQGLNKPTGMIEDSRKNSFPGEDALQKATPDFDARYIIRFNSGGGFAYGAIPEKDIEKTILAITKAGSVYRYRKFDRAEDDMVGRSWSCRQNDGFESFDTLKDLISAIINADSGKTSDGRAKP